MKTKKLLISIAVMLITFILAFLVFYNWDALKELFF
jgi:hypothetical protein